MDSTDFQCSIPTPPQRTTGQINPGRSARSSLLVCVGPRLRAGHLIRKTAELAGQSGAPWHAVYIETPKLQRLPSAQRERILNALKLAQDLGATTTVLADNNIAQAIADYARSHAISKIVLGRSHAVWPWRATHFRRIASYAPHIDLVEIGDPASADMIAPERDGIAGAPGAAENETAAAPYRRSRLSRYMWAAAASLATALVTAPLSPYLDPANIVMLFLLTVVLTAVQLGRGAAIVATLVGVAAFDFFFVAPRFSFSVSDFQYLVTFVVMLAVGLIVTHLTADLRYQARVASHRESRSRALYEFARELSGALQTEQVFDITRRFIQRTFRARATLLLPDDAGRLQSAASSRPEPGTETRMTVLDIGIAQWAFDHAEPAGTGTRIFPNSGFFYLPLVAPMRTRGVLVIQPENRHRLLIPEQRQHLDTFATLAAIALERVHYIDVAQEALVRVESERLRNSLLSALSHDLRTPLTSLVGLSDSLSRSRPALAPIQQELAQALHDEALRMSHLVANLLDMARLQSGAVKLNLQWQPFEEVVGSALRASHSQLTGHRIRTELARDLPLVQFDAALLERVLCNLLENAAKYTPAGSCIVIAAQAKDRFLNITVRDNGPGLPAGREEIIFEKFSRGVSESSTPGVGLGLAICKAIVSAHAGTIRAETAPGGGASFVFTLPLGQPPAMLDVPETDLHNLRD